MRNRPRPPGTECTGPPKTTWPRRAGSWERPPSKGSLVRNYTMDIENTVRVLTRACPGNLGVTTPYHPDMRELTPGQYSWHPQYQRPRPQTSTWGRSGVAPTTPKIEGRSFYPGGSHIRFPSGISISIRQLTRQGSPFSLNFNGICIPDTLAEEKIQTLGN
jgi:hypothetical protein